MIENFSLLLKKTVEGDMLAWENLKCFFIENKLTINEQEQVHLYFKKQTSQYVHAVFLRGLLYDEGLGVAKDLEMTFLLMREAAAAGHSQATYEVGRRFLYGIGIERNISNALQWIALAAESPHYVADAMYQLGLIYRDGIGVNVDLIEADRWFIKAKMKGYQV